MLSKILFLRKHTYIYKYLLLFLHLPPSLSSITSVHYTKYSSPSKVYSWNVQKISMCKSCSNLSVSTTTINLIICTKTTSIPCKKNVIPSVSMDSGDFGENQPGKNQGRKTDERRSRRDYLEGIRVTTAGNWSLNVRRRNERNVSRPYPWISVTYRGGIERFKERNERASLKMFPRWSSTFSTVVLPLKRDPVYLVFYPKGCTPWWACLKHVEFPREFLRLPQNPYDVAWFCRIIAGFLNFAVTLSQE